MQFRSVCGQSGALAAWRFPASPLRYTVVAFTIVATLIVQWPSISAQPANAATPAPVYPLKLSANGRYLVDQVDQPFFWSGDASWSLIVQASNADTDYYFANRQQKGFNAVLVNLIDHKFGSNAPRNINGDPPFTGTPFTTPNDAYFAHADYAVATAAQKGMVVLLDPLYLGYNCADEGWCAEVQAASTADLQSWGQYVGTRYKTFDNIVWLIGGDVDPSAYSGVSAKVSTFVTALKQADARHLISAHNTRGQMAVSPWPGASWLNVNNTYSTYAATYQAAQSAYNLSPPKPFFQVEGYYENEHAMTTQQLRAQAYWTVLSGGMGFIFGNCPAWGVGSPAASFCSGANPDWKSQLNGPGSTGMMYAQQVFSAHAWQNLAPDWSHTLVTAGYGAFGAADYATAARTPDGTLGMAYLPTRRTVTVDMSRFSGAVTARWYDPSNGAYSAITGSPFAATGTQPFTPLGNNSAGDGDWVLVLEATGGAGATSTPTVVSTATPTPTATATPTSKPTRVPTRTPKPTASPTPPSSGCNLPVCPPLP